MNAPHINAQQSKSDTLYIRGISRRVTDEELLHKILNQVEDPVETDLLSKRNSGVIWARYGSLSTAHRTMLKIHQSIWHGVCFNAKFEMGFDSSGKRIVAKSCHNTVIRSINYRKGYTPSKSETRDMKSIIQSAHHTASYSSKSLQLGNFEYPFPSGLYLARVVQLTRSISTSDPLLQMITDPCLGNKYSKEISEIMAMVDATERAVKLVVGEEPAALSNVTVYALGDGKRPLSAAAICLHMPATWNYVSIDPLLEVESLQLGDYRNRFTLFSGLSQDFDLLNTVEDGIDCAISSRPLSIVIALHSHAPLSEFWTRLGGRKVAITMECCAEYSELHSVGEIPVLEFDDFEVYSPKRTVKIYSSCGAESPVDPGVTLLDNYSVQKKRSLSSTGVDISDSEQLAGKLKNEIN